MNTEILVLGTFLPESANKLLDAVINILHCCENKCTELHQQVCTCSKNLVKKNRHTNQNRHACFPCYLWKISAGCETGILKARSLVKARRIGKSHQASLFPYWRELFLVKSAILSVKKTT